MCTERVLEQCRHIYVTKGLRVCLVRPFRTGVLCASICRVSDDLRIGFARDPSASLAKASAERYHTGARSTYSAHLTCARHPVLRPQTAQNLGAT
jgi:hypothetical protein